MLQVSTLVMLCLLLLTWQLEPSLAKLCDRHNHSFLGRLTTSMMNFMDKNAASFTLHTCKQLSGDDIQISYS